MSLGVGGILAGKADVFCPSCFSCVTQKTLSTQLENFIKRSELTQKIKERISLEINVINNFALEQSIRASLFSSDEHFETVVLPRYLLSRPEIVVVDDTLAEVLSPYTIKYRHTLPEGGYNDLRAYCLKAKNVEDALSKFRGNAKMSDAVVVSVE